MNTHWLWEVHLTDEQVELLSDLQEVDADTTHLTGVNMLIDIIMKLTSALEECEADYTHMRDKYEAYVLGYHRPIGGNMKPKELVARGILTMLEAEALNWYLNMPESDELVLVCIVKKLLRHMDTNVHVGRTYYDGME